MATITGGAIDPPSLRPPIADATIERVEPAQLHARLEALRADGYTMLLDLGAADYPLRTPRFDVVYHLLKLSPMPMATNASAISSASSLTVTRICAASRCRIRGKGIRCVRIIRCAARRANVRRARPSR